MSLDSHIISKFSLCHGSLYAETRGNRRRSASRKSGGGRATKSCMFLGRWKKMLNAHSSSRGKSEKCRQPSHCARWKRRVEARVSLWLPALSPRVLISDTKDFWRYEKRIKAASWMRSLAGGVSVGSSKPITCVRRTRSVPSLSEPPNLFPILRRALKLHTLSSHPTSDRNKSPAGADDTDAARRIMVTRHCLSLFLFGQCSFIIIARSISLRIFAKAFVGDYFLFSVRFLRVAIVR